MQGGVWCQPLPVSPVRVAGGVCNLHQSSVGKSVGTEVEVRVLEEQREAGT